jgi:hypothetical protein
VIAPLLGVPFYLVVAVSMVSPTEVLKHKGPTSGIIWLKCTLYRSKIHVATLLISLTLPGFLCPLSANIYGIDFLEFQIRDMESKKVIFHVKRDKEAEAAAGVTFDPEDDSVRFIKYDFGAEFLKLKTIGARYACHYLTLDSLREELWESEEIRRRVRRGKEERRKGGNEEMRKGGNEERRK